LVEKQGGSVGGAGPVGALGEPAVQHGVQPWVDRDLSHALAFARILRTPFAGGPGDVVDVEGDDLADPRAGVERDERERLVARRQAGLDGSEVPELGTMVERARRRDGGVDSRGGRRSEAAANVEVIDGGERVVDSRGAALQDGLEVGAVVAHRPVPAGSARERILVEVGAGEPRQVLADFRSVGTAGLSGERSCRKSVDVVAEQAPNCSGSSSGARPRRRPGEGGRVL
jgi:hypothetical protein